MGKALLPGRYLHVKSGKIYELISAAFLEKDVSNMVVYRSVDTSIVWVRPLEEFRSKFMYLGWK